MSGSPNAAVDPDYPYITIAIPTYNRAQLAKGCVENALAQTYRNIEVLVSDNASPDDTVAVLNAIGDKRLRVLTNQTNTGAVENFSKCIREAKGEYLVLLSDDNLLDADFLEKCARMIRAEPGLPIVLAAYDNLVIDEFHKNERRIVPAVLSKKLSNGIWDGIDVLREYFQGRLSADSLSVVVRTDIVRLNNHYSDESPRSWDKATWIPALLEGRAGLINERCATYMVHDSSFSSQIAADARITAFVNTMDEIANTAADKISDQTRRREIQKLAMRYLAYQVMVTLVLYRRAGASLTDVVRKLWDWRMKLKRCTLIDFVKTARLRSLGRILLPTSVIRLTIALGLDKHL